MRWLDERGIGVTFGPIRADGAPAIVVPIVPAAILFDLWVGDARIRPDAAAGYAACEAATRDAPAEGNVGAGAGAWSASFSASTRAMRGGIGTASIEVGGITVAALVAVNAMGDVVDPRNGRIVAGARSADGTQLPRHDGGVSSRRVAGAPAARHAQPASATTLAIVATDAVAHQARGDQDRADGARRPGAHHQSGPHDERRRHRLRPRHRRQRTQRADTTLLGALAADVLAEAVLRAVARGAPRSAAPACRACRRRAICRRPAESLPGDTA